MRPTLPETEAGANVAPYPIAVAACGERRSFPPTNSGSRVFDRNGSPRKTIAKPQGKIAGFKRRKLPGAGIEIDALVGGSGPPLSMTMSTASTIGTPFETNIAGAMPDCEIDEASRGREVIDSPALVLWPKEKGIALTDPLRTWRSWARDVRSRRLDTGHFIAEEAPREATRALHSVFS
jgi:hypothetical protein